MGPRKKPETLPKAAEPPAKARKRTPKDKQKDDDKHQSLQDLLKTQKAKKDQGVT